MGFRENLRFVMGSKGIQAKELSAKTGISENTIKTYLKEDSSEPKVSKAVKLAKALNVTAEYLVTGINKKNNAVMQENEELFQNFDKFTPNDKKIVMAVINTISEKYR